MGGIGSRLRLPATVQDAFLALFVAVFQLRGTVLVGPGNPSAALARPYLAGYLLLVATGLALAVRRQYPVVVFAALTAASAVYYLAGYPDGPSWVALFVAAYSLAAHGDGRRSVQTLVAGLGGLSVVWLLTAHLSPLNSAGWVFFRVGGAVMAAALGESVRSRRVIAEEAIERAERAERVKEIEARERVHEERLRIARDVHDTVAHALAVINVHAGVTAHLLDQQQGRTRDTLVTIEKTSARALGELRATLGVLRAASDRSPTPGLAQVEQLAAVARDAGVQVTVQVDGRATELPASVDHTAYRILQEAMTNVVRHAAASRATIVVGYHDDRLRIEVRDDGAGRTGGNGQDQGTGRGIIGMQERAALLGGLLTAAPHPGGGFRVHADLPLQWEPRVS
jgi:signal transduction histidine kinase